MNLTKYPHVSIERRLLFPQTLVQLKFFTKTSRKGKEATKKLQRGLEDEIKSTRNTAKIPNDASEKENNITGINIALSHRQKASSDSKDLSLSTRKKYLSEKLLCFICHEQLLSSYISIEEKTFHKDCLKCVACNEVIDQSNRLVRAISLGGLNDVPMHKECFDKINGKKCAVCFERSATFSKHIFFKNELVCTKHLKDAIRRCDACTRYEPIVGCTFFDLNDSGRCLCLLCYRTVIFNGSDMQTLWNKVLDFFGSHLQLSVWDGMRSVPVVSVGSETLNESSQLNGKIKGKQRCRGMCVTEYGGSVEVSAILCLTGLPSDLTSSILAHEATHAWLSLHPDYVSDIPIPPFVEEGLCQLVAYLFLSESLPTPSKVSINGEPSEENLRQFFRFSIESDACPVYGLGFRRASEAYAEIGIEPLLSHVLRYRDFPQL